MYPLNLNSIKLVWWNVNLSTVAKPDAEGASQIEYDFVLQGIEYFLNTQQCKVVALCEVSEKDILALRKKLPSNYASIVEGVHPAGKKTRFDTVLIYDHRYLDIEHDTNIIKASSNSIIKSGQIFNMVSIHDQTLFKLILCHWPSRAITGSEIRRENAASLLAYKIQAEYLKDYDVIIMGDFNDNPSDKSIYNSLKATRCHEMAIKYPEEWLYNPFWRENIPTIYHDFEKYNSSKYPSGTYRCKAPEGAYWHTLDQILLSGSLISTSNWQLNEKETKVVTEQYFTGLFTDKNCRIDHLPITCELEYRGSK